MNDFSMDDVKEILFNNTLAAYSKEKPAKSANLFRSWRTVESNGRSSRRANRKVP